MTNLEKIREACIKANPEIMELKFGCWIKAKNITNPLMFITDIRGSRMRVKTLKDEVFTMEKAIIEILGRPIRLADVLVAILAKNPAYRSNINLEPSGQFKVRLDNGSFTEWDLRETWNLKDDNLEHQSEETINFIASLL